MPSKCVQIMVRKVAQPKLSGRFRENAPKLSHSEGHYIYFGNKEVAVNFCFLLIDQNY